MASYLAYVLYPPLYIAGPVLTFNGFASQLKRPRPIGAVQVCRTMAGSPLIAS
jgi:D-alanyl-lipoteichoic acid acyltransferase DltB (MBOAT superfamily)